MRTGGGLGDDGAAVGVPAQQHRRIEAIEGLAHGTRIGVEVGAGAVVSDCRQLEHHDRDVLALEQRGGVCPHPGSCEAARDEHHGRIGHLRLQVSISGTTPKHVFGG